MVSGDFGLTQVIDTRIEVRQLSVGGFDDNFSYLVVATKNGDAAVIDPCGDVSIIKKAVEEFQSLNPKYILLTHGHHDHVSGIAEVKSFFPAPVGAHSGCSASHTIDLDDHQILEFGEAGIEAVYTPGHTDDGITYRLMDDSGIFTGDTLFVDWCGYCNAGQMFRTMREIILPLAGSNIVYSGHNYGRKPATLLGEEKISNPYLNTADFEQFKIKLREL